MSTYDYSKNRYFSCYFSIRKIAIFLNFRSKFAIDESKKIRADPRILVIIGFDNIWWA